MILCAIDLYFLFFPFDWIWEGRKGTFNFSAGIIRSNSETLRNTFLAVSFIYIYYIV